MIYICILTLIFAILTFIGYNTIKSKIEDWSKDGFFTFYISGDDEGNDEIDVVNAKLKAEYDNDGSYGCSQHYAWIKVNSKKEAECIIAYLHSEIISFLRKATQWTASWSRPILDRIPDIPKNKVMNNEEIFKFFGLTSDEIAYIEGTIK